MQPSKQVKRIILLLFFACTFLVFGIAQEQQSSFVEYDSLGDYFRIQQEFDSSIYYFKLANAVAIGEENPDHHIQATNRLALLFYYKNNLDSMNFYLNTVSDKIQHLTQDQNYHQDAMVWWSYKSAYYSSIGENHAAMECTRKSIEILEYKSDPDTISLITQYQNVGQECGTIGDFANAIKYSEQALLLSKEFSGEVADDVRLSILNSLGWIYSRIGDFQKANRFYQSALSFFELNPDLKKTQSPLFTKVLFNTGLLAYLNNDTAEAEKQLVKALQTTDKNKKISPEILPDILHHLALVYDKTGNNTRANKFLTDALKITLNKFGHKSFYAAIRYKGLGDINNDQVQAALSFYQKALVSIVHNFNDSIGGSNPQLDQTISSKKELLNILQAKANIMLQTRNHLSALATFEVAINLIDTLRLNFEATGSKYFLQEKSIPIYEGAIQAALASGKKELAFQFSEKSKAVLLLENIKNSQAQISANLPEELLEEERRLKIEMAFTERKLFSAKQEKDQKEADRLQKKSFNLKRNYEDFLTKLEKDFPKYYRLKYDTKIASLEEIQHGLLDDNTALLEYFVGDNAIYIFIITKQSLNTFKIPKVSDFEQKIEQFQKLLSNPSLEKEAFKDFADTSFSLYNDLLKPALNTLDKNVNNLLLIPDGQLNYLPFQTFIQQPLEELTNVDQPRYDTLQYLIRDYCLSYGYSATLLLEMKKQPGQQKRDLKNFVGFAPLFNGAAGKRRDGFKLDRLVHSKREVLEIGSIVGGRLFLDEQADKAAFLRHTDQCRILHLSTHATMSDSFPASSCIHLYDDNITVGEIYNLPLNAGLAVLSACETGTGKLQKGEGLMSLARAFTYAGCPGLITSLWKVNDYQTSDIMIGFYEDLYTGKKIDAALQSAQLGYLKNALHSYEFKHPYYWAGFVMMGNNQAVFDKGFGWWKWLSGALFLGLIFMLFYGKRS